MSLGSSQPFHPLHEDSAAFVSREMDEFCGSTCDLLDELVDWTIPPPPLPLHLNQSLEFLTCEPVDPHPDVLWLLILLLLGFSGLLLSFVCWMWRLKRLSSGMRYVTRSRSWESAPLRPISTHTPTTGMDVTSAVPLTPVIKSPQSILVLGAGGNVYERCYYYSRNNNSSDVDASANGNNNCNSISGTNSCIIRPDNQCIH